MFHLLKMKKLFLILSFSSFLFSDTDWNDQNDCSLPDNNNLVESILNNMTLEQKVGQIIMPEINSITPDDAKKYQFGTILNGGGGFPNKNKNSSIEDWKNLSKSYYESSPIVNGIRVPILSLIHISSPRDPT